MKKIKLGVKEEKIMAAIERDEYMPVTGKELQRVADSIAARKKDLVLTIRVNKQDIQKIKKFASSKGIPYQSFLSELIHRVAASS